MPGELKEVETDAIPLIPLSEWKGQEKRIKEITTQFINSFQHRPTHFVRVPGRVNLIGEHVDYCGYGVFPMAIEQDVLVAIRISGEETPKLRLINSTPEYPPFECLLKDVRHHLEGRQVGVSPPWHLYYLCGLLGVLEKMGLDQGVAMEICVDGRVPPRAGLSSSSALVCAAALATLVANEGEMGRKQIASLCASSERYIGTQGGGMDQAIAFLATAGTAQRIEFLPELSGEKVLLPPNGIFVIANSLVEANKAASDGYNVRVAECRLATWLLARAVDLDFLQFEKVKQLQDRLGWDFQQMLHLVQRTIHKDPYTPAELATALGLGTEELSKKPLMCRIPFEKLELKLYQRVTHVLEEAARVHEFHTVSNRGGSDALIRMGELMTASHQSLRNLYECSHPKLDRLVELAQAHSHGARLTGAGWGGCMVALLSERQLSPFLEALKREYYQGEDIGLHVFISQPGAGAAILY